MEIEIIDELTGAAPAQVRRKIELLNDLSAAIQRRYGLAPSARSKYEVGLEPMLRARAE
ncbi:MAG: hypothetical protein KF802_01265 [Bdellovibrionaceae bacterium]|nr:hypothetical protein [Pseudobdellovibrionaceae bacterium]MBX3034332.1 hypothetical protein [Pseudobdellovibrionaceae bacterium]